MAWALLGFEVAGQDGNNLPADAAIADKTVSVSSAQVPELSPWATPGPPIRPAIS